MIICINPDWRIESDPLQWIVQKRRFVRGAERWTNVSYHTALDTAVIRLAQTQIHLIRGEYPPEALPMLCQALDNLKSDISVELGSIHCDQVSCRRAGKPEDCEMISDAKISDYRSLLQILEKMRRELVSKMARGLESEPDRVMLDQAIIALTSYTQLSIIAVEAVPSGLRNS